MKGILGVVVFFGGLYLAIHGIVRDYNIIIIGLLFAIAGLGFRASVLDLIETMNNN